MWRAGGLYSGPRPLVIPANAGTGGPGIVPELRNRPYRLAAKLACLLTDIGSACYTTQEMAAIRDDCAVTVRQRGGVWSVR